MTVDEIELALEEIEGELKPMHLAMGIALANGSSKKQAYLAAGGAGQNPYRCAVEMIEHNPRIAEFAELAKRLARIRAQHELEITEHRIMQELACMGFANLRDAFDAETGALKPLHQIPRHLAAAIVEYEEQELRAPGGDGEGLVIKRKVKLASKKDALQLLGNSQQIQMFRERKLVESSVDDFIRSMVGGDGDH